LESIRLVAEKDSQKVTNDLMVILIESSGVFVGVWALTGNLSTAADAKQ